jgi:hypothetical protein
MNFSTLQLGNPNVVEGSTKLRDSEKGVLLPTLKKGYCSPPFEKGVLCPTFVMKNTPQNLRAELKKWLIYLITYKIVQIPVYKEKVGEFEKEKDFRE